MRRNISISGNIKLEYQLEAGQGSSSPRKKETVSLQAALSDHSQNTLTHKEASFELISSAYPHLNVGINGSYQQALGHLEIRTVINSSPLLEGDDHKLTIQLSLTNSRTYLQNEGAKISAYVTIKKPAQNVDIKIGMSHMSHGPETKTNGLIRYAPGKLGF